MTTLKPISNHLLTQARLGHPSSMAELAHRTESLSVYCFASQFAFHALLDFLGSATNHSPHPAWIPDLLEWIKADNGSPRPGATTDEVAEWLDARNIPATDLIDPPDKRIFAQAVLDALKRVGLLMQRRPACLGWTTRWT